MNMTATQQQPGNLLTRWTTTVIRAFRHVNDELLGAGEAMARSNRYPNHYPQPAPAQATQAQPASSEKVLAGV